MVVQVFCLHQRLSCMYLLSKVHFAIDVNDSGTVVHLKPDLFSCNFDTSFVASLFTYVLNGRTHAVSKEL